MKQLKRVFLAIILGGIIYFSRVGLQQKRTKAKALVMQETLQLFATTKTLETARMQVHQIISGEQNLTRLVPGVGIDDIVSSPLFKENMTLDLRGTVRAGVLLNKLESGAVQTHKDKYIDLTLPLPVILGVYIAPTQKDSGTTVRTQADHDMEEELRTKAQKFMLQQALKKGILEQAKANTTASFQELFSGTDLTLGTIRFIEK